MLAITAVAAVVAAMAAEYWRRQTPGAQEALLVYWGVLLLCVGPVGWIYSREISRQQAAMGPVFFVLYPTSRFRLGTLVNRSQFLQIASLALPLLSYVVLYSHGISKQNSRNGLSISSAIGAALFALLTSLMIAVPMQLMLRKRILFGGEGLSWGGGLVPWKYIRHAEWLADRPGSMKLRRLDGDFYFDVPSNVRDEVEAFVRSKTTFVDGAAG